MTIAVRSPVRHPARPRASLCRSTVATGLSAVSCRLNLSYAGRPVVTGELA
jgi:hypothetical protein